MAVAKAVSRNVARARKSRIVIRELWSFRGRHSNRRVGKAYGMPSPGLAGLFVCSGGWRSFFEQAYERLCG